MSPKQSAIEWHALKQSTIEWHAPKAKCNRMTCFQSITQNCYTLWLESLCCFMQQRFMVNREHDVIIYKVYGILYLFYIIFGFKYFVQTIYTLDSMCNIIM